MALKARLASIDGLPESIAAEYKQVDGAFVLDVEADGTLELVDTSELKSTITKTRKERDDATKLLKRIPEGISIDDLLTAQSKLADLGDLDELATLDEKLAEREKQLQTKFENDAKRIEEKFQGDLATVNKHNETLTQQLHGEIVQGKAMKAITSNGGVPELLLPVVTNSVRVVKDEESGQMVAKVFDAKGQVRLSPKSGSSADMSIDELVLEMRDDKVYARAFDGDNAGGGGTKSPGRAGADGSHRITAADARDPHKYQAVKAAAEKAGAQMQIVD